MSIKQLLLALTLLGFMGLGISSITTNNNKLKFKDIQIQSKQSDLLQTELKFQQLNTNLQKELEAKTLDQEKIKQLEEEKKQLQEKEQKLQAELQAKAKTKADEQARIASAASKAVGVQKAYAASGDCETWKAQAGIASTPATRALIGGESGCRPHAVNPSSGACGIPQALPCSKMPCTLQDPVCQLRWMNQYVAARYGSWDNAYATWLSRNPHWY